MQSESQTPQSRANMDRTSRTAGFKRHTGKVAMSVETRQKIGKRKVSPDMAKLSRDFLKP